MQQGADGYPGAKSIVIQGSHVEFVVTNGDNQWDTPDPSGTGKKNYTIESPGK